MARRGETREKIIKAAEKCFFEHGYEETTVRMIQDEANVVTGSFYHFFSSKELLFEVVVERFLAGYTERINAVLENEELSVDECLKAFLKEIDRSASIYYEVLQGDKLHWTIQHALHNKTIETMVPFIQKKIDEFILRGKIISRLDTDSRTLATVFIKGIEAIIHSGKEANHAEYHSERIKKSVFDFFNLLFDVPFE